MTTNKLAPLIESRLPSYVHDQYPVFVSFITTYFEWLDETDNFSNFLNAHKANIDIDRSNDNYVDQFLQEFAAGIPSFDLKIPKKELVKLIREFYISKGTEDSFKFIFRVLYDQDVNVFYPRELMFATSDNIYEGDFIMNITKSTIKEYFIKEDSIIYITDNTTNLKAFVDELKENVDILGNKYFQAYLSSYDEGLFTQPNMDLKLEIDGVVYNTSIVTVINDIDIEDGGRGYAIGNEVYIEKNPINGNSGMFGNVSAVTNGGIETITIINGGDNYTAGDYIGVQQTITTKGYGFSGIVKEVDINGTITKVEIVSQGFNFENNQAGIITTNYSNVVPTVQAEFELSGDKLGSIKRIKIQDGGHIHDEGSVTVLSSGGLNAVLNPIFTNIFETPKYTTNQKGFTSFNNVLTDSWYYQQFSYLVSSYEKPNEWKHVVSQLLHPAGLVQFNNWLYESESGDDDIIGFTGAGDSIVTLIIQIISEMIDRFLVGSESETKAIHIISESDYLMVGHNLRDLDSEKLLYNFKHPISSFDDVSIEDVYNGKPVELNLVNDTYIFIPIFKLTAGTFNMTGNDVELLAPRLPMGQGSFAMTGNDITMKFGSAIPIVQGSYLMTGNDTTLIHQFPDLVIETGSFLMTGNDVGFDKVEVLSPETGSFLMTGNDVGLTKQLVIPAAQGSYSMTGNDVIFDRAEVLSPETGIFTMTGNDVGFEKVEVLSPETGIFTMTGNDVGLTKQLVIPAAQGTYSMTGNDITLTNEYPPLVISQGTFLMTGKAVLFENEYPPLIISQGTYSMTGKDVTLTKDLVIPAAQGTYSMTGKGVGLTKDLIIEAGQGTFTQTGKDVGLTKDLIIPITQGTFTQTGKDVGLTKDLIIDAAQGTFLMTGNDALFVHGYALPIVKGTFTQTGKDVGLTHEYTLPIVQGSYSMTGKGVTLTKDLIIDAAQGTYSMTGKSSTFIHGHPMSITKGTYSMTGKDVTLTSTGS